jgi:hypothetical protein
LWGWVLLEVMRCVPGDRSARVVDHPTPLSSWCAGDRAPG